MLLGFARALRAAGVAVTADRERTYLEAVAAVGLDDQPAVYFAGRATLCASPADLERYDLVYTAWFSGQRAGTKDRPPLPNLVAQAGLGATESPTGAGRRRPGCRSRAGELDRGAAPPRRRHPHPPRA